MAVLKSWEMGKEEGSGIAIEEEEEEEGGSSSVPVTTLLLSVVEREGKIQLVLMF